MKPQAPAADPLAPFFDERGPGAALAVQLEGRPALVACRGLADLEAEIPITPETPFELASVSKIFTATAILWLVERGGLCLDQPLGAILPSLGEPAEGREVRIADLLKHTSGIADYLELGAYTPVEQTTVDSIESRLVQWIHDARPGVAHVYSNTNYFILSRIVEAVAGEPWAQFIETHLVHPDEAASFSILGGRPTGALPAKGYRNLGTGLPLFEACDPFPIAVPGDGGVTATLAGLLRWFRRFWAGEILTQQSLDLMCRPGTLDRGELFDYGFGLQVERDQAGGAWLGHGGSWTTSTVLVGRYLPSRCSVIVLSNELMAPVETIAQWVARDEALLGE